MHNDISSISCVCLLVLCGAIRRQGQSIRLYAAGNGCRGGRAYAPRLAVISWGTSRRS
ncbi:hypothetical protein PF008_g5295 [Phytophthora fragariae]|uniref:Secreted protein n=1 Tax=Phytophthora fragariae TaxID=53985 RepID=A0A6G0SAG7_9STRA|nr:hypothetical protein PF008_g5295 [Phytophthora fragariae]